MRRDLVRVLYQASLDRRAELEEMGEGRGGLMYEFGKTVAELAQTNSGVDVTFSNGQKKRYDLVVGADGQRSRTRRLVFGQKTDDEAISPLGVHAAYYSIPRVEGEGSVAKCYFTHHNKGVMIRTGNRPVTQVYLFAMNKKDTEKLKAFYKEPIERRKEVWTGIFQDAGWDCDRFPRGLATCDDFYTHEVAQVRMKQLHNGRVVLLGDAGYCPTPLTGAGTTASLIGSYVLAGELSRHGNDIDAALNAYEEILRDPINEYQKLPDAAKGFRSPSSQLGVWLLRKVLRVIYSLKIDRLFPQVIRENESGWCIPE